jgi:hypothetical protein
MALERGLWKPDQPGGGGRDGALRPPRAADRGGWRLG